MRADDRLSLTFQALADPTRRAILARLGQGDATVGELAKPFRISLPAVSRHLKVLEAAGLIARERAAQWRRCRLNPAALDDAVSWIEQTRAFWRGSLDRLEQLFDEQRSKEERDGDHAASRDPGREPVRGGADPGPAADPEGAT
jgi:DNA-binding transcriptional ArsR family regulator